MRFEDVLSSYADKRGLGSPYLSDATPIIYLGRIRSLSLLEQLYERVYQAVFK
jgi:hypothetical protein